MTRSRIGLALFDRHMALLHRFAEPVLCPDANPAAADHLGAEDPRVTWIDGRFVMIYSACGVEGSSWRASLCAAESSDLLHWRKTGPLDLKLRSVRRNGGSDDGVVHVNNKDGALFPARSHQWQYLLHRPMIGPISEWAIHLARSRSLSGSWEDLGPILWARPKRGWTESWVGAGAVPLPLGGERFLEIYHSGHLAADGSRLYTLGAAVLDLSRLNSRNPEHIVESRLDHFLAPRTSWELHGPYPDSVANVVFTCGAYDGNDGDVRIVYGGGDTYVLAADVAKAELLAAMKRTPPTASSSKIVCREN